MARNTVVLVRQAGLGHLHPHDASFGVEMFDRFLHALEASSVKPSAICFYTEGVKLVCEGSPVIPGLQLLQGIGVRLVICGTCLEYFNLRDKVAVGEVGGMNDIVGLLLGADQVVAV
ncbi:MAG: DsrE family protein [Armatimonadota bacterium]|nr:DsrE family protein [Armatimonadota bacterium]